MIRFLIIYLDQIHEYFEMFGPVVEVKLKTDIYTGQSRGFAFLLFQNAESVDKVIFFCVTFNHPILHKNSVHNLLMDYILILQSVKSLCDGIEMVHSFL